MATTIRWKKSGAESVWNLGAMSTPAVPAKSEESAHEKADTRSAAMPLSSVRRELSTTERMRSPRAVKRNSSASSTAATSATPIMTSSLRLKAYTPNGS
jgi:hypothetical protein